MFELIGRAKAIETSDLNNLLNPVASTQMGSVQQVIVNIIMAIVWFAGAIAVGYLVYGGILYITAGGDAEKATKGKTAVINAIIGMIIVLLSLVIVAWVKKAVTQQGQIF